MPPSTDPRVLECVELVLAGDGTPEALSQALEDEGLKCTEARKSPNTDETRVGRPAEVNDFS